MPSLRIANAPAIISASAVLFDTAACRLPYIQTAASASEFGQEDDSTPATGYLYGSSWEMRHLFDRQPLPGISGTGSHCFYNPNSHNSGDVGAVHK